VTAERAGAGRGTKARAQRATTPRPAAVRTAASPAKPAPSRPGLDPDRLAALEEERDFLLGSLRDLEAEHDVGDVDDGDYEALKDDYTARAAAVLRAIESHQLEVSAARPRRSPARRALIAAAVALFAVLSGVLVAQWSGARGTGDTITGGVRGDTRDQLLQARQAFAQSSPQYLQAIKLYDKVLQEDPANVEALAYRGWMYRLVSLQATGGQRTQLQTQARDSLAQALRTDPHDATSLIFMAAVLDDLGQPSQALADLDTVPAGEVPSVVTGLVSQLRSRLLAEQRVNDPGGATSSTTAG
jgi:tetratricopeptide (TPR) repeat protein